MAQKVDINHVTKFDGTYFNKWKHTQTLIFKAEKLWPLVSGVHRTHIGGTNNNTN
jgi:hypothetical protein